MYLTTKTACPHCGDERNYDINHSHEEKGKSLMQCPKCSGHYVVFYQAVLTTRVYKVESEVGNGNR